MTLRSRLRFAQFYDQVGWQQVSEGQYQNARYEDLRPVSREYIHRCHLRVNRHLAASRQIPVGCRFRTDPISGIPDLFTGLPVPGVPGYFDRGAGGSAQTDWRTAACSWWPMWPTCRLKRTYLMGSFRCTPSTICLPRTRRKLTWNCYRTLRDWRSDGGGQRLDGIAPDGQLAAFGQVNGTAGRLVVAGGGSGWKVRRKIMP